MDWDELENSPWFWIGSAIVFLCMIFVGFYLASSSTSTGDGQQVNPETKQAYQLNKRGLTLLRSGRYQESVEVFKKSLQLKTGLFVSRYNLALSYYNLGQYRKALKQVNKAISLRKDSAKAYHLQGLIHKKNNKPLEAIDSFQMAVKRKPDKVLSYFHMGKSYQKRDEYSKAIKAFEQGLELSSSNQVEPQVFAHLAGAYFQAGQYKNALENFNRAIKHETDDPSVFYIRKAYLNFGLKNYDESIKDTKNFLDISSGKSKTNVLYAQILRNLAHRLQKSSEKKSKLPEIKKNKQNEWPGPIVRYLAGEFGQEKLVDLTEDVGEKTEAHYYICMKKHLNDENVNARKHCKWVQENGRDEYYEYHLAKLFLKN